MLTPLEIENKEFKKGVMGYDKLDVEEFMSVVLRDYEALYKENIALKDKINMLSDGIKQYKTVEETLQNTLIMAQTSADEVRKNAQQKADNIIKEANIRSDEIIANANRSVFDINNQYNNIKRDYEMFKAKMLTLLNSQIVLLNELKETGDVLQANTDLQPSV